MGLVLVLLFCRAGMVSAQRPQAITAWIASHGVDASAIMLPREPREPYRRWFEEVITACGCMPVAIFEDLHWHLVPRESLDGTFNCLLSDKCLGWWWETNDIFLAEQFADTEWVVKHEMLHAILGRGDHPPAFKPYQRSRIAL